MQNFEVLTFYSFFSPELTGKYRQMLRDSSFIFVLVFLNHSFNTNNKIETLFSFIFLYVHEDFQPEHAKQALGNPVIVTLSEAADEINLYFFI